MALPKPSKRAGRWTLLLVEESGRTIQIRWFKTMLCIWGLLVLTAVGAAGTFYWLYDTEAREAERLRQALAALRTPQHFPSLGLDLPKEEEKTPEGTEAAADTRAPAAEKRDPSPDAKLNSDDGADTRSPLLSRSGDVAGNKQNKQVLSDSQPDNAASEPSATERPDGPMGSGKAESTSAEAVQTSPVAIEGFACSYNKSRKALNIKFKVTNADPGAGSVAGHAVVVLKPSASGRKRWRALPEGISLKSGKPDGKDIGSTFSIANYKTLRFRTKNQWRSDYYKTATVYIFDKEGENLLMKADFPIEVQ